MGTTTQPRRIFRVTVRFADGRKGISRQVRCPVGPRRKGSLRKLDRLLGDLTVDGTVASSRVTAPDRPIHRVACLRGRGTPGHKCECFPRWTDIPQLQEVS